MSVVTTQELDEAVARKLGAKPKIHLIHDPIEGAYSNHAVAYEYRPYSTSIEAAWEIVEKIRQSELVALCWHDGYWHCEINCCDGKREIDEEADTAPMAICKAFLALDVDSLPAVVDVKEGSD